MAKPAAAAPVAPPPAAPTAPVDYQTRPQGITPRVGDVPHPRFGRTLGIKLLDPESLKVPRTSADGQNYLDDPYLALMDGRGGWHISQIRADHAAEMLTCDPVSGGAPNCRLATDAEVVAHLKIHGAGMHGNVIGKKPLS